MRVEQAYLGKSELRQTSGGSSIRFSPNLERPKVFFDAELQKPLRFREAISALHEVVVGDLRHKVQDRAPYAAYQKALLDEEAAVRQAAFEKRHDEELAVSSRGPMPKELKKAFHSARTRYFDARSQWIRDLRKRDSKLWWLLDPVITVAPDTVFFECFSKDESSYGCLHINRDAFVGAHEAGLGTTNVDYSLTLYEHFQTIRSYRPTRLSVDPQGFEVEVTGHPQYREEKVDLPESWLRGFGQIQSAQMLPSRRVPLSVEAVYNILIFLLRHREKAGPRSLRFELEPGRPPAIVIEPWEKRVCVPGRPYEGDTKESIKVWGRRRLGVLARLLPLADAFSVHLLGSGLPSLWVAHMGEMHFTLCLSGWTQNDWTSGAHLDLLAGHWSGTDEAMSEIGSRLGTTHVVSAGELESLFPKIPRTILLGSLYALAKRGQVIFDHATDAFRYRQVMPEALGETLGGAPHPELTAAKTFVASGQVRIDRSEHVHAKRLLVGVVNGTACEVMLNADGGFIKARCTCRYAYKNRLRKGPCRHALALKLSNEAPSLGPGPKVPS